MLVGYIYKISNDINDKIYVGKTLKPIRERFLEHGRAAKKRIYEKRPLYNAINKYGLSHFQITLLEECPIEKLSEREQYWIAELDSYDTGYNATLGGDGAILLNYQDIINGFLNGKLLQELANEFECSTDAIHDILIKANLDPSKNALILKRKQYGKSINCWDAHTNDFIQHFETLGLAAEWAIKNGYTNIQNKDNVVAAIGRVVNGKRKCAFGFIWTKSK